jgi:putative Mn2+ efflux pump MntP
MKDFFGFILFVVGLGLYIEQAIKNYGGDISWWFIIIIMSLLGFGLDLMIIAKIDTAKEEMRKELEEKLEKIREI